MITRRSGGALSRRLRSGQFERFSGPRRERPQVRMHGRREAPLLKALLRTQDCEAAAGKRLTWQFRSDAYRR